jgi:tetratricopeptide (TPR) repeat protein
MIDINKDEDTAAAYRISAVPTFIILDVEGKEEFRHVGVPFRTPDAATGWIGRVTGGLENVSSHEAAYAENEDSFEHGIRLARTYSDLGRDSEALRLFDKFEDELDSDADDYVDIRLAHGDALLGTLTQENQAELAPRLASIYGSVVPSLIEDKDERAIDPGMLLARIKVVVDNDLEAGRKQLLKLAETFPDTDKIWEIRVFAAVYAMHAGNADVAKAELESVIEDAEEAEQGEHPYIVAARQQLAEME